MRVRYLEIVTNEFDATCAIYERLHGVAVARDPGS